jgi:nucleoside-diphosphate-sugar epimerase
VARVLIVPCGCRGRALARELAAAGHAVRGTTRHGANANAIAAAGAEPYVADPGRLVTLMDALAGVAVVCWLMRSVALDGGLDRMLFERLVDTPVRGVVYEGSSPQIAREASERWRIPLEVLGPADDAKAAVDRLLGL